MARFWARHFPDSRARAIVSAPSHSRLDLSTVTAVAPDAYVEAVAEGLAGDAVTIEFSPTGTVAEGSISTDGNDIRINYLSGSTTMEDVASLFSSSTLVQLRGTWTNTAILNNPGDTFSPTNLSAGAETAIVGRSRFWDGHFPDRRTADVVFAPGPSGVAEFALPLENTASLTLSWATDTFKAHDGTESRAAPLSNPKQTIEGQIILIDDLRTDLRSRLRRYAATGQAFLLGIPFEGVPVIADATDEFVAVPRIDLEWMSPGQRAMVLGNDEDSALVGVIQSVAGSQIEFDQDMTTVAKRGAIVMPVLAVLLDPQQTFDRYPVHAERWSVRARVATFGWKRAATLALSTVTGSGVMNGVVLTSRLTGDIGNEIEVSLEADSLDGVTLDEGGTSLIIHVEDSATPMSEFMTAMEDSLLVRASGDFVPTDIIVFSTDEFANQSLSGGGDLDTGELTSTIALFDSRPVWDRYIQVQETVQDSIQSLSETIDLGGIPFAGGELVAPEWGRTVSISRSEMNEYLWLRGFLHTVRGAQVAFWLPTWRTDLRAIEDSDGSSTIVIDREFGDFFGWSPQYDSIQIRQGTTLLRLRIDSATDTGTSIELTVSGDTLPSAAPIDDICWLELCRFESPDFTIAFEGPMFSMSAVARVVTQ